MNRKFSEEQIIGILKQHEAGVPVKDLLRQYNVSEQTFYRWKSKYSGMDIREAQRLRQMEDENRRLKQLVAELTLDNQALKWVVEKNDLGLPAKKK